MTKPLTAARRNARFDEELDRLHELLNGQTLISQDHCVDALLDLYNTAPGKLAQELIGEIISDIRFVSAVRAQLILDDLSVLSRYC